MEEKGHFAWMLVSVDLISGGGYCQCAREI